MNASFILGMLNAAAFMLCVSFVAYVTLIVMPFLRHKPAEVGSSGDFTWHFLLPCLDEEAVVEATVAHLIRTFPTAHVWCVDDASGDATGLILTRLARRWARVHVVTRRLPDARSGKGPALNAGWQALRDWLPENAELTRTIVGVVDADSRLDPKALDVVAGETLFADPGVGAVQIQVRVINRSHDLHRRHRLLVNLQDLEFTGPIAAMQLLRRRAGSVGMGGNGQFTRMSVLDRIASEHGTPWHGALLEDFELGLHVLLSGDRNEYCHDTWVKQDGLQKVRLLVRQRSRWAQGSMQCMRYLNPVLRSARISTPGALEIAYFLFIPWTQLVGSVVFAASTGLMFYYGLVQPGGFTTWLSDGAWAVAPLFLLFGLAPLAIWGPIYRARVERGLSLPRALALGLANWVYSYLHYAAVWWAFARIIRSRSDWKKTARTVLGPINIPVPGGLTATGTFKPRAPDRGVVVARLKARPTLPDLAIREAS
jgi:1,2-diacylglycerol 3-beta-glucosyltransferase